VTVLLHANASVGDPLLVRLPTRYTRWSPPHLTGKRKEIRAGGYNTPGPRCPPCTACSRATPTRVARGCAELRLFTVEHRAEAQARRCRNRRWPTRSRSRQQQLVKPLPCRAEKWCSRSSACKGFSDVRILHTSGPPPMSALDPDPHSDPSDRGYSGYIC